MHHYQIDASKISVVGTGRGKIKPFRGIKDYQSGFILFVAKGRFEEKGGFLLIEAFKLAQRINQNFKLILICPQGYKDIIPLLPNMEILSSVSWEKLQSLFNHASLFAMPALNEPWGLVYLEALACKVPILGLNRNSLPEITQNGNFGFLCTSPEPADICEKILEAFSNIERLALMGTEGQHFCLNTFSWSWVADGIITQIFKD